MYEKKVIINYRNLNLMKDQGEKKSVKRGMTI